MVINGMPQQGMMGATQIGSFQNPYVATKHTEANSIANLFGNDMNRMFLGILKPWNMMQYFSTPLISMTELAGNVIEVPNFGATLDFLVPFRTGPSRLRGVRSETGDKWGINNSVFFIETDKNEYTFGDVITNKKRDGVQLRVCLENEFSGRIIESLAPDLWSYAVTYVTLDKEDYVTPDLLPIGSPLTFLYNSSGEFSNNRTTLKNMDKVGMAAMRYITGDGEIGITHSVTSWGDTYRIEPDKMASPFGVSTYELNEKKAVTEYLQGYYTKDPATGRAKFVQVTDKLMWVPTIIQRMVEQLALMKEHKLMWAKPHFRTGPTGKKEKVAAGYYYWVKELGNYSTYSEKSELPNLVRYLGGLLFSNRRNIKPEDRRLRIRTGTGGCEEMYKWFTDYFKSSWAEQFVIVNDGQNPFLKGQISGKDSMNLAYRPIRFVSAYFPGLGNVEVIHDPVLDFIDEDFEMQGREGLYNYSSYMIFMEDLTDAEFSNRDQDSNNLDMNYSDTYHNGSNVFMIKPKGYVDTTSVQVGTGSNPTLYKYFGENAKTQKVTGAGKGFTIYMDTVGELFVKDPTRVVMIEYVPKTVSLRNV